MSNLTKPYLVYRFTHTLIPCLDHRIGSVPIDGVYAEDRRQAELLAEDRNPVAPWESLILISKDHHHGRKEVARYRRRRNRQINELREMLGEAVR